MKCLTHAESERWLASFGVSINENDNLEFPKRPGRTIHAIRIDLPKDGTRWMWFFSSILDWMPNDCNRMLWLYSWHTYPPYHYVVFEKLRRGCGEFRHIIDAPGHLFDSSAYDNYENKTDNDVQEDGVLAAMVLLMVSFDWEGYIVTDKSEDRILIGDEYLEFYSTDYNKMQHLIEIAKSYGLTYREGQRA